MSIYFCIIFLRPSIVKVRLFIVDVPNCAVIILIAKGQRKDIEVK